MNNNGWTEVGGDSGDMWDKEGSIEGTYVSKKTDVGPKNSNIYNLQTKDGLIGVWGSAVLDTKMDQLQTGAEVRITHLGMGKSKSGNEYHDYKVEVKPPTFKEVTSDDIKAVHDVLGGEVI